MGGEYIKGPGHKTIKLQQGFAIVHPDRPECRAPCAFHLPEVCRQVYSETTMLAYKHNIFILDKLWYQYWIDPWTNQLLPVQRRAITAVVPTTSFFLSYLLGNRLLRDILPNLKCVEFTTGIFWSAVYYMDRYRVASKAYRFYSSEAMQEWIIETIQIREGDDIEVKFEKETELESVISTDDSESETTSGDDSDSETESEYVSEFETSSEDEDYDGGNSEDDDDGEESYHDNDC
jgi:hypothetical protein